VLSYEEHHGAINTLTFIDNNRKFVSTADDKKVFIWEFGIPVVLTKIAEPNSQAVTATAVHPSGQYVAMQKADNKVEIYD
jgi:pre-mRNA-processing factor 17